MWYLVIPPIVVVSSLFFLLWYLLRKGSDPVIAQKVLSSEKENRLLSPGLKDFFLKLIEKLAQRFKVGLLRAHNTLNEFTQWVKKMRTKMEVEAPVSSDAPIREVSQQEIPEVAFASKGKEFFATDRSKRILDEPIVRRERNEEEAVAISVREKPMPIPRPMLSEAMTRPEIKKSAAGQEGPWEEGLIARIARDPKDFTAYEELGDHYLEAGNIKDAKECYRQVLKLSPVHRLVKIKIRRLEKLLTKSGE